MDELIKRLKAATDEERAAMLAEMTEGQKWEIVATLEKHVAMLEKQQAALEAQLIAAKNPAPTNFLARLLEGTPLIRTPEELKEYEALQAEGKRLRETARKEEQAEYIAALEQENRALTGLLEFYVTQSGPHFKE